MIEIVHVTPARTKEEQDLRAHAVWNCLMIEAYAVWNVLNSETKLKDAHRRLAWK